MFGYLLVDFAMFVFIAIVVLLVLMVRNEHQRLRDPYVASFVRSPPNTWRWHVERLKLMISGGIPKRS